MVIATLSTIAPKSEWKRACRIFPKSSRSNPASAALEERRIQVMSRWPTCWIPRSAVDEVVNLPLQDRLEVRFHLAPSDVDDDAHLHRALLGHIGEVGPDHFDLAVRDVVQLGHAKELETTGVPAAELDAQVGLSDYFSFERRAVGYGDRHVGNLHLESADLDALLHQLLGLLEVVRTIDLVPWHADHMLVGRDTGRKNLGESRCRR